MLHIMVSNSVMSHSTLPERTTLAGLLALFMFLHALMHWASMRLGISLAIFAQRPDTETFVKTFGSIKRKDRLVNNKENCLFSQLA